MDKLLTATLIAPSFEFNITDASNNSMKIDIPVDQGGNGNGMRPMQTMLAALCGCSAVDIISILKKQKQAYDTFTISISGEREKDKEPALWQKVHAVFAMKGSVEAAKLYRAAELSITKYCSVAETLRRAGAVISFEVVVNQVTFQN
jgi:putative redox protein